MEVLPQACSKKRVSFSNQRGSLESFAGVLYTFFMMVFITTSFGDGRFKAVFWWEICRVAPFETLQVMTQKAMDIEDIVKSDHLFHPMRQLQRRSGAFFSKFQESEDRQMVASFESGWSLFKDSQKHVTCRRCLHFYLSKWRFV